MEQNNAATGQPTTQEVGAEAMPGDGSELESDWPSSSDETQQQPNAVVQGEEVGEINKTAAGNQKKETHSSNTHRKPKTYYRAIFIHTGCAEREWERRGWYQKEKELEKIKICSQNELVDMGRLFVQKYFQLHSNFNDIVNYTL